MKKFLLMITGAVVFAVLLSQTIPPQQEKKLRFEFSESQTSTILQGLNELPAKVANPIIQEIYLQASKQIQDTVKNKK